MPSNFQALAKISNRKRSRACEDESCEFTPISKRINNLHIRSGMIQSDEESPDENCNELLHSQHCDCHQFMSTVGPSLPHVQIIQPTTSSNVSNLIENNSSNSCIQGTSSLNNRSPVECLVPNNLVYNPELSEITNPHYYQINSLLFNLHLCRLQRLGKPSNESI